MRLLLDEHLSARRIATPLRRRGHNAEALHEEPRARGMPDEEVLERATEASRIVVTRNARDFIELARAWADERRSHAGILVVWGHPSTAFDAIVESIHHCLATHPEQDSWVNLVLAA